MVILYHKNNEVAEVVKNQESLIFKNNTITSVLFEIAEKHDELILWCDTALKENLNFENLPNIFHHKKIMASYNLVSDRILSDVMGYVDESPFIKVNKEVSYPTWLMSGDVGGIHASVLLALKDQIKQDENFDYFLCSIAKQAMPFGLLSYSEPKLINEFSFKINKSSTDFFLLFKFVKQHYRTRWVFLLFLNLFLYERKFVFLPFFVSLFYSKRNINSSLFDTIEVHSNKRISKIETVDVIIPTIGRKNYLYDFLKDLAVQTHLPVNVIIIEQNPDSNSLSELDYLSSENWPFAIKHTFTHQSGACNARNLALLAVESQWVFMADDDIRIESDFLEKAFKIIEDNGIEQVTFGCYLPDYAPEQKLKHKMQWSNFGSGCSIVKSQNIKTILYNRSFEFGYGEDSDFGMQLRNLGCDILYSPLPEITHLKAPVGGFRTKPILAWAGDVIQPKPSPTVMLYKILNLTKEQLMGYKTVLFFKFYKAQSIKNPIVYFKRFNMQWNQSLYWADKLKNNS